MAYQTVYQCDGCGNMYQAQQHNSGFARVPAVGQSEPFVLDLSQVGAAGKLVIQRVLCTDCAACVERAIKEALARR